MTKYQEHLIKSWTGRFSVRESWKTSTMSVPEPNKVVYVLYPKVGWMDGWVSEKP
jgi:hypothetical protein